MCVDGALGMEMAASALIFGHLQSLVAFCSTKHTYSDFVVVLAWQEKEKKKKAEPFFLAVARERF